MTRLLAAVLLLAGIPTLADEPTPFMNLPCGSMGTESHRCREIHVRVKLTDKDETSNYSVSGPPSKLMRDLMAVPGVESVFISKYKVTVYRAYLFDEMEVGAGVIAVLEKHGKIDTRRRVKYGDGPPNNQRLCFVGDMYVDGKTGVIYSCVERVEWRVSK